MANKARTKAAVKGLPETEDEQSRRTVLCEFEASVKRLASIGLGPRTDCGALPGALLPFAPGLSDGEFARRARMLDAPQAHEALVALMARVRNLEALLARVRCYAVVDPLGNPGALGALRMVGIERDIDDACAHVPDVWQRRLEHQRLGGL